MTGFLWTGWNQSIYQAMNESVCSKWYRAMKREAGENPAQGRCCIRPEFETETTTGQLRGKVFRNRDEPLARRPADLR